jgi:hypothetical protein
VSEDIALGMSGSAAGVAGGDATDSCFIGAIGFDLRAAFFFGAAFFTGAALTAFFATFLTTFFFATFFATFLADFAFTLFLAFALTFIGRFFPFLAAGRFFALLFFAMINLLLEIVRTRCESSPEKVCCHLRMMLESHAWNA